MCNVGEIYTLRLSSIYIIKMNTFLTLTGQLPNNKELMMFPSLSETLTVGYD